MAPFFVHLLSLFTTGVGRRLQVLSEPVNARIRFRDVHVSYTDTD